MVLGKEVNENGIKAIDTETLELAIQIVETPPIRAMANCRHTPADLFKPGEPMEIEVTVEGDNTDDVYLYYRHVNQALDWQMKSMKREGENYQAVIPGQYTQTRYPMEYYFAVDMGKEGIAIYPGLDENLANMPYYVIRQTR